MKHRHDTQIREVVGQEILACYSTDGCHRQKNSYMLHFWFNYY